MNGSGARAWLTNQAARLGEFLDDPEERRGELVAATVVLALCVAGTITSFHLRWAYNSDEVSQVVLLRQWVHHGLGGTWLPPDTYLLKLPVDVLVGWVLPAGRVAILVSIVVQNILNICLLVVGLRTITKLIVGRAYRQRLFLVVMFFLATLSAPLYVHALRDTNPRTFEIGLSFCVVGWLARLGERDRAEPLPWGRMSALAVVIGVMFLSDPAFLLFLVPPLIVPALAAWIGGRSRAVRWWPIIGVVVGSVISYEALRAGAHLVGVHIYAVTAMYVPSSGIVSNLTLGIVGLLGLFHADLFGLSVFSSQSVVGLANLTFIGIAIAADIALLRTRALKAPLVAYLGCLPAYLLIIYVMSTQPFDEYTSRYLIVIPTAFVLILGIWAMVAVRPQVRLLVVAVCVVTSLVNIGVSADTAWTQNNDRASHSVRHNEVQEAIIRQAHIHHLSKGYATYWNANMVTYLADSSVSVFSINCNRGDIREFRWNYSQRAERVPAGRSFVLVTTRPTARPVDDVPEEYGSGLDCDPHLAVTQFGPPAEVVRVTNRSDMYIYDFDLGPRLHRPVSAAQPW